MRQAWPITAERRFAAGRVVIALLIGSLGAALAGCGSDGASAAGAAGTSSTSASSTTSTTVAGTTSESSTTPSESPKGSGSTTTTATSSPASPPKAASAANITLGWIPPTQNSDGSPVTDLAGYKIHYGATSSEYTKTIALANAGLTRYVVENLSSGTYYFAITAYNSQGVESALSAEISTIVD